MAEISRNSAIELENLTRGIGKFMMQMADEFSNNFRCAEAL
jgi:hypothetical protein